MVQRNQNRAMIMACGLAACLIGVTTVAAWGHEKQAEEKRPASLERHAPGRAIVQEPNPSTGIEPNPAEWEELLRDKTLAKIAHGDPTRMEIALTFDDGPHPAFTPRLLDRLKQLDVRATFFVVGQKVDMSPESAALLRRMIKEGHDVANHTYHHFNLKLVPQELVESEIRLDNDAIRRACGLEPIFFRPSGGQYNSAVIQAAKRLHMIMVLWTDDPADYSQRFSSGVIEDRLLNHVRAGAIILLHDGIQQTYDMLPDFVARMRRYGYKFVTISEMAEHLEAAHLVHP